MLLFYLFGLQEHYTSRGLSSRNADMIEERWVWVKRLTSPVHKLRRQERGMDMSHVVPQKVLCIGLASPHEIWMYLPSSLVTHIYIYIYYIYTHI